MSDYLTLYLERWDVAAIKREAETGTPVVPITRTTPAEFRAQLERIGRAS